MCNTKLKRFLAGLLLALALGVDGYAQSPGSRTLDAFEDSGSKPQAISSSERELLARLEQRSEALWSRLFEVQMQEIDLQGRVDYLDYRLTPDGIWRALAFVGSVRPMDELRDGLRTRLEDEKTRVSRLLEVLVSTRQRLDESLRATEAELERLRRRLSAGQ